MGSFILMVRSIRRRTLTKRFLSTSAKWQTSTKWWQTTGGRSSCAKASRSKIAPRTAWGTWFWCPRPQPLSFWMALTLGSMGSGGPACGLGKSKSRVVHFEGTFTAIFLLFKEGSCKGASWGTSTAHQVLCEKPQPGKGWCLAGLAVLGILMRFMDRMLIDLFEQSQDLRFSTQVVPRRDWYGRIEWIYFPVSNPTEACWLFFARSQLA